MRAFRQQRAWYWIAIAAIVIALVALLVPHGHATNAPAWIALLPAFFVVLLLICSMYIAARSYNPFIYFRF
jgi:cell division protein FtsW (lipid II flippase)